MNRAEQRLEFDGIRAYLRERLPWKLGETRVNAVAPVADFAVAQQRQTECREWLDAFERGLALPPGGFEGNLPRLFRLLDSNESIEPEDFLEFHKLLGLAEGTRRHLGAMKSLAGSPKAALARIADFRPVIGRLEEVFDDRGRIKDGASPDLRQIRKEARRAEKSLGAAFQKFVQSEKHALRDSVVTLRAGRFVVPVRSDRMDSTRFLVHDVSDSGATLFAEPVELLPFNNERQKWLAAEVQEVARILIELAGMLRDRANEISQSCEALSDAAYFAAVFRLAGDFGARFPKLKESGGTQLQTARHPFLGARAVPCDVALSAECPLMMISGPNAGGKTVVLKTVGLLTLMASCGLPVPAQPDSELMIPSDLFVILGDEQSLEADLSTFTARLLPLKEAMQALAKPGSRPERILLLLDELGAGTDPDEGAAFAEAVVRFLCEHRVCALVTTHFARLKSLAYELPGIQNAALLFHEKDFTPTYQLRIGTPGPSLGLKVARFMGLPEPVLKSAETLVASRQSASEQLLAKAQQEWMSAVKLKSDAEHLWHEAQALKAVLDAREGALEKEGREKAKALYRDAEAFVKQAKHHVETIIKNLEGEVKLSKRVREQKEEIWRLYRETFVRQVGPADAVEGVPPAEPVWRAGDRAWLPSFRQKVEVVEPADKEGFVIVRSGAMSLRVKADELMLPPAEGKPAPAARAPVSPFLPRAAVPAPSAVSLEPPAVTPGMQVYLTGMTADVAVHELDLCLNRAFARGIAAVRVIHGKGTGKLKTVVRVYLSESPLVKSHSPAGPRDGGDGVTIATLEDRS
ncbi:MAG: endonuclease MutS2 [bacterium]